MRLTEIAETRLDELKRKKDKSEELKLKKAAKKAMMLANMTGHDKKKKPQVTLDRDDSQKLLTCTLSLNRYKADIRDAANEARQKMVNVAKACLPDGRPHSLRCLRQLEAGAHALEKLLKDYEKQKNTHQSDSESGSDDEEAERQRVAARGRRRGGVTALLAPSATWQFANLQEVPMLRLLNVLNTQPRYVDEMLAAKVLQLSEQYTEWCVEEVKRLNEAGADLTSMEQAKAYIASLASWVDRQAQEQEAIREDWEDLTFEEAEHRRRTMFTAYVARVIGYPAWQPTEPNDRGDGKGKKCIIELPAPVAEIDSLLMFDFNKVKARRQRSMPAIEKPAPTPDMPLKRQEPQTSTNNLFELVRPSSKVSTKPGADAEAALAALNMIDVDALDASDHGEALDLLNAVDVPADDGDIQEQQSRLSTSLPHQRSEDALSNASSAGNQYVKAAKQWCKQCLATFVGAQCPAGHPVFMYAPHAPDSPPIPTQDSFRTGASSLTNEKHSETKHRTDQQHTSLPNHLIWHTEGAASRAVGGDGGERWCKKCKKMFSGRQCGAGHPE
eukprot:SAG31_NODE_5463_length_2523_cov_2.387789_1_plen_556_part_10